ncbi:NAD(P)/FAD-dependent oxidoreductase [Jongsikchunia kroppenstedtii]|uniref:NAD(P)/FAD-dependent oxidoreductase n=1 Tax=Jongsikchunia kroppenstedtii TaxID=1121721 RepID=UPI00036A64E4|nr:FAD-dependent oxidoreductase [Jongsikchunia kroppenstedtii]
MTETNQPPQRRIAVIGSGVSGLTAAWVLARHAEVTLFEAQPRLGGHAHTHRVTARSSESPTLGVDSGFIVHNDRTYPTLMRLFDELGVVTQESDMSMSVRCDGCGLEYAGAKGLRGLFAEPRSVVRRRYLRMLAEVPRFHRLARAELARDPASDTSALRTLGDFLTDGRFTAYFTNHFMVPLVAAVWSCPPNDALNYPVRYLLTFLEHHGMLTVFGSPTWRTVSGGSAQYVTAIAAHLHAVHPGVPVRTVTRTADGVAVRDDADRIRFFDAAVVATHPADALRLLAEPSAAEREILGALDYSTNSTILHTDTSVLPRRSGARASWNYRLPGCSSRPDRVLVSYDLNRLQRLSGHTDRHFVVTLGDGDRVDPDAVIESMVYEHPQYSPDFVAAQQRLPELGDERIVFAGAYHGWGFHEDGALSGAVAAARLGGSWLAPASVPSYARSKS